MNRNVSWIIHITKIEAVLCNNAIHLQIHKLCACVYTANSLLIHSTIGWHITSFAHNQFCT